MQEQLKSKLKLLTVGMAVAVLQACASTHYSDTSNPHPEQVTFIKALASHQWIKDEYAQHQSRLGYKEFAIAVKFPKIVTATGFADDKVSKLAAYHEVLRMCRHFSQGVGQCRVVHEQVSSSFTGLTQT
tara:strand:+ start:191 stop:577 length:387 start_codon:yes stop_codon:yes gene_type:complete